MCHGIKESARDVHVIIFHLEVRPFPFSSTTRDSRKKSYIVKRRQASDLDPERQVGETERTETNRIGFSSSCPTICQTVNHPEPSFSLPLRVSSSLIRSHSLDPSRRCAASEENSDGSFEGAELGRTVGSFKLPHRLKDNCIHFGRYSDSTLCQTAYATCSCSCQAWLMDIVYSNSVSSCQRSARSSSQRLSQCCDHSQHEKT